MGLSLTETKVIILFCFLIMTFLFGMIPVIFIRYIQKVSTETEEAHDNNTDEQHRRKLSKYKRIMSFLSCFAGGVFLGTCFLELLPDVQRNLLKMLLSSNTEYSGFPAAEFVMVCGLFIILITEQIVLTVKERATIVSDYAAIPGEEEEQPILARPAVLPEGDGDNQFTESYQSEHSLGGICDEPHVFPNSPPHDTHVEGNDKTRNNSENFRTYGLQRQHQQSTASKYSRDPSNGGDSHAPRHDHHQKHSPADHQLKTHSPLRAMLLLIALAMHSIFEGISVGLQPRMDSLLSVYAALTLHKSILSFSLGMNLVQSKISVASGVKSIIGFSIASPLGVAIGIMIMDLWTSTNSVMVQGILQGIASGTFLYIIFFEILPKEFNCEVDRLLKVLFLIIGYATVTGLIFLGDDAKDPLCKSADDINP